MLSRNRSWLEFVLILLLALQPAAGGMMPMTLAAADESAAPGQTPTKLAFASGSHHAGHHGPLSAMAVTESDHSVHADSRTPPATADEACETLCQFCVNHCSALGIDWPDEAGELKASHGIRFVDSPPSVPREALYRPPILA